MANQTKINWKAVVLYGLIAGIIIIFLLYFLKLEPFHTAVAGVFNWVGGLFGGLKINVPDIITKNWPTIAGFGAMAVPLIYTTIKGRMEIAAKTEALKSANELLTLEKTASSTTVQATQTATAAQIADLQNQIAQYESDPAAVSLQTTLSQLQTQNQQLQGQINYLQSALEAEIQKRPVITQTVVK